MNRKHLILLMSIVLVVPMISQTVLAQTLAWEVDSNPSGATDSGIGSCVDDTFVYFVGRDNTGGDDQWRVEKRFQSNGTSVANYTSDPTVGNDRARDCIIEANATQDWLYVVGGEDNGNGWRIEKIDPTALTLDSFNQSNTGAGGALTDAFSIDTDGTSLYVAGGVDSGALNNASVEKWSTDLILEAKYNSTGAVSSAAFNSIDYDSVNDVLWTTGRRFSTTEFYTESLNTSLGLLDNVTTSWSTGVGQASSVESDGENIYVAGKGNLTGTFATAVVKYDTSLDEVENVTVPLGQDNFPLLALNSGGFVVAYSNGTSGGAVPSMSFIDKSLSEITNITLDGLGSPSIHNFQGGRLSTLNSRYFLPTSLNAGDTSLGLYAVDFNLSLTMTAFDEDTLDQIPFDFTMTNATSCSESYDDQNPFVSIGNNPAICTGDVTITAINGSSASDQYDQRRFFKTIAGSGDEVNLYLLKTANAVTETFKVKTLSEVPVVDALITVNKTISGNSTTIAEAKTDGTGQSAIPLNPSTTYTVTVSKDGFEDVTFSLQPSAPFFVEIILGQGAQLDFDQRFGNILFDLVPRNSFVQVTNGTGNINLTVTSSLAELEWFSLNLTYNNTTVLFFENNTNSTGGFINGFFNLTSSLNLTEPFNFTTNNESAGFPRTIDAIVKFKKFNSTEATMSKEYRMVESIRGIFKFLAEVDGSAFAKGLIWMTITTILTGAVAGATRSLGMGHGILALLIMGVGVYVGWLSGTVMAISVLGFAGLVMYIR